MKKALLIFTLLAILIGGASYVVTTNSISNTNNNSNQTNINTTQNQANSGQTKSNPLINESELKIKATDFKLKDLNGKDISLSDLKGKKIFLNFWASWCPPCEAEMPDIEKLYQETKGSDLVIIAVNLGEEPKTVKSFIDSNKYNFKVLLDEDQSVAIKYNITAIPTSYFVDKEGNIVSKKIGAMTYEEMKGYIESLNK